MAGSITFQNMSQREQESLLDAARQAQNEEGAGNTWTGQVNFNGGALIGSSGSVLSQVLVSTVTLTPVAVGNATISNQSFVIGNIATSEAVFVSAPTMEAGLAVAGVYVSAPSTVSINYVNTSAATITPMVGAYRFLRIS